MLRSIVFLLGMLWFAPPSLEADVKLDVIPDVASGVYNPGSEVTWTVRAVPASDAVAGKLDWVLKKGGLEIIAQGQTKLHEGVARLSGTRDDPGVLLLEVTLRQGAAHKRVIARGGAVFDPDKIRRSSPVPDDFDAFWSAKIKELDAVGMNVQLEAIDVGDPEVEYFRVTMDNIRGRKIYGQIAKPKGGKNLPAMLQVQWAGVYPLERAWVIDYAKQGWLSMNILAHDLPIDRPAPFYKEKAAKELADYRSIGADDRESSYFLPMFLSCRRAVDYLVQRKDWNHRTILVHGGSQGGYQAIVTAGLHPAVTGILAGLPAGCDHTGRRAGRAPGWPNWTGRARRPNFDQLERTSRYFDAMNFAPRAKCNALIGVGLIDVACPPEGILATANQFPGDVRRIIMPRTGHGTRGPRRRDYSVAFGQFLESHRDNRSQDATKEP